MEVRRRPTREIRLGWVKIGGSNPVVVQSMTNTDTRDVRATLSQVEELVSEGCEVVRVAVPDERAARALSEITKEAPVPIVADIHFDWRLGVLALEHGAHGLRINPGNIKGKRNVKKLVEAARAYGACLRIGVNAGSLERDLLKKYGGPKPEALVESALRWVDYIAGELGFENIKVSLKSSDVLDTVKAYRLFSERSDFPLHLGVTEAGGLIPGTVKSAVGLGILLADGIGDTLRVSLTAPPVEEVRVAWEILKALKLRRRGPEIVACPPLGRCEIYPPKLSPKVEKNLKGLREPVKVAVMGCVVNGPGEAREADIGVAGGKGVGIIFKKGRVVKKVPEKDLLKVFLEEIKKVTEKRAA